MDIDPRKHLAYVANRGCECITILDILNQDVVGTIPLGDKAQAITVDTSENQIYVSYLTQNKVVKIDGLTNEIVSSLEIPSKPWDMKIDPTSHKLYAALKSENNVLVMGPTSYSIHLPVLTMQTPAALVGLIHVHGQDVNISNPMLDVVNTALTMNIGTDDGGRLSINVPRYVLDSKQNDADVPFEVSIDGKTVKHQEYEGHANDRSVSLHVESNSKILSITGNTISEEMRESLQTMDLPPMTQEPMHSKGFEIICEGKVWVENLKGKIACTLPSTAQKLIERGWGTMLE